jgi:hypothetical protein
MTSPYSSHNSSLTNLSKANNSLSSSAPPVAALPQRSVPAGTLPPGTNVTVGKHNVTIERWLSEGTTPKHKYWLIVHQVALRTYT